MTRPSILDWIITAGEKGGWVLALIVALTAVALIYLKAPQALPLVGDNIPAPEQKSIVPATGEAGYPVEPFCRDDATRVSKSIAPPDATFVATYDLDRVLNGVHEHVTVSVRADGGRVGTYYDSSNNPRDANVTDDAFSCITRKVR